MIYNCIIHQLKQPVGIGYILTPHLTSVECFHCFVCFFYPLHPWPRLALSDFGKSLCSMENRSVQPATSNPLRPELVPLGSGSIFDTYNFRTDHLYPHHILYQFYCSLRSIWEYSGASGPVAQRLSAFHHLPSR